MIASSRRAPRRRRLGGAVAVLAAAPLALPPFGAGGPAPPSAEELFAQQLSRPISVRVFHTRIPTVRTTNARRIGRSLAGLRPTWVQGLIRYAKGQHPNRAEVRGWREITRIVRTASPQAQFDVTLNALQYRNARQVKRMMNRVRKRLRNNGWFFDFFSTAYLKHPRMVKAAIASAHAHGEWIGGNVFGLASRRAVPARADFLSVQDFNFKLNLPAVRRLGRRHPVLYHLNNNPGRPRSGGCRFIKSFSSGRRRQLIRHRAKQQARYNFRVSYPALFPECKHNHRGGPSDFLFSYNVFRDPPVRRTVVKLLNAYQ